MLYLAVLKNLKKILDAECGCRCGWLSKFKQFFLIHSYISGKVFMKIRYIVLREVANRPATRMTDGQVRG